MNAFNEIHRLPDEQRVIALSAWYRTLENRQLRMDCPDAYHEELVRQADEMERVGLVTWPELRDLRQQAGDAYLHAVTGKDYR